MKQASDVPVRAALCLMAMLAFVTILSQFFRSSLGVIGPEVIRELGLSSGELGLANASFFIALLLAQIPVGLAFDRIGPRLTVTLLSGFAVAGALLHTSVVTAG
ncbi:MAG: MFS transporter, partial [Hyphomicrobiaceae bacterium]